MKTQDPGRLIRISTALLMATALHGQIQHNGTVPIAPQPAGMPAVDPSAPFRVTAVTYAALPPNDHYSANLTSTAGGKAFGYLMNSIGIIFDPLTQTVDFSNQFSVEGSSPGLQVMGTDGPDQTGIFNDGTHGTRCFVQTPAGFSQDARFNFPTGATFTSPNVFAADYASVCTGVDHGVAVGNAYNEIFTETVLQEGILSQLTGYSQTAFAGNITLGLPGGFLTGCCARARGIHGDQVVGDTNFGGSLPLPPEPLGLNSSPAANANSTAAMWLLSAPDQTIQLAGAPSVALATNGVIQGGWASSHAVIWSSSRNTMVDLNPPGYFDSRVTGISAEFQVGDGWLGGPANSPGAVQHALLWRRSAASVIDLNQFLPPTILGASINGVDQDGNIVGVMTISTGQTFGLYIQPNGAMSLASLTVNPANAAPGSTVTATVTLQAPATAGGVMVSFTSDNSALVPAPAPVLIPEGQSTASFPVAVANTFLAGASSVALAAHAGFTARTATLGVSTTGPVDALTSFTLSTSSAAPGDTIGIQVGLAAPAPAGGVSVNFASSNAAVVPAPFGITIPQGATSASTSVIASSTPLFQPVTLLLQAQTGNVTLPATLTMASLSKLSSVALGNPQNAVTSVPGNTTGTGFIPFTAVAAASGIVTLSSSNPALLVPQSTPFPAGNWYASFPYTAIPVAATTSGTLSATSNGVTVSAVISVTPSPSPTIQSVTIPVVSPTKTFSSGQSATGTVALTGPAFLGGMTVALATDSPGAIQIPATITIPGNTVSATFPVTALPVAGPTAATITATLAGFPAVTATVSVIPGPALAITSLSLAPYSMIGSGVVTTGTIALNQAAPAGGVTVAMSASAPSAVKMPASVTIPAGQTSANVSIQGNGVNSPTALTVSAAYTGVLAPLGTSGSASLTVAPTDSLKAPKPTWSTSTHLLTATCTSTNPAAIISVLNASGNVALGTMTNLGNGNYSFQLTISSIASINFKSNLGGATGQGVTVVP